MNIVELTKGLIDIVEEDVEVNGFNITIKKSVSLEEKRVISLLIANNSFKLDDEDIATYDIGLREISRNYMLLSSLTNISLENDTNEEEYNNEENLRKLENTGVLKAILDEIPISIIEDIDRLTDAYVHEIMRKQELKGSLGYSIKDIIGSMNNGLIDTQEIFEQVKFLQHQKEDIQE